MGKLFCFAGLLALSVFAAGVFGALHNQVSYSVAPEYFHVLKFPQFRIPADMQDRAGAAAVGVAASWWTGAIVGVPVLALALRVPGTKAYARVGLRAIAIVTGCAAITSAVALGLVSAFATPTIADGFDLPRGVIDRVAFLRAGAMHEGSYFGGLLGLIAAMIYVYRSKKGT